MIWSNNNRFSSDYEMYNQRNDISQHQMLPSASTLLSTSFNGNETPTIQQLNELHHSFDSSSNNSNSGTKSQNNKFVNQLINQHNIQHQQLHQNQLQQQQSYSSQQPPLKKPRLVFTDIQRRTLQAIFKETKRPSKEMQVTIAQQLGLEVATVSNFFMNARRRSMDKWKEGQCDDDDNNSNCSSLTK